MKVLALWGLNTDTYHFARDKKDKNDKKKWQKGTKKTKKTKKHKKDKKDQKGKKKKKRQWMKVLAACHRGLNTDSCHFAWVLFLRHAIPKLPSTPPTPPHTKWKAQFVCENRVSRNICPLIEIFGNRGRDKKMSDRRRGSGYLEGGSMAY